MEENAMGAGEKVHNEIAGEIKRSRAVPAGLRARRALPALLLPHIANEEEGGRSKLYFSRFLIPEANRRERHLNRTVRPDGALLYCQRGLRAGHCPPGSAQAARKSVP